MEGGGKALLRIYNHKQGTTQVLGQNSFYYLGGQKTPRWKFNLNWSWVVSASSHLAEANIYLLWGNTCLSEPQKNTPIKCYKYEVSILKNHTMYKDYRFTCYQICMLNAFEKKKDRKTWQRDSRLSQMSGNTGGKATNKISINEK